MTSAVVNYVSCVCVRL